MGRGRRVRVAGPVFFVLSVLASSTARSAGAPDALPVLPPRPLVAEKAVDGLDPAVLRFARAAYESVRSKDRVARRLLTVIDYRKPSTEKRLWVLDMETGALLFHELVAHGKGSGDNFATQFGNEDGSNRTSLGVFLTAETYSGKHGYSLRLDGLESGINDRARDRAIVIHPADYVSVDFATRVGRLGRSHGCPAVNPSISKALIDAIAGGSVVVAYGDDEKWLTTSAFAPRFVVAEP